MKTKESLIQKIKDDISARNPIQMGIIDDVQETLLGFLYSKIFTFKCFKCNDPIEKECLRVQDQLFHGKCIDILYEECSGNEE